MFLCSVFVFSFFFLLFNVVARLLVVVLVAAVQVSERCAGVLCYSVIVFVVESTVVPCLRAPVFVSCVDFWL